MGESEAVSANEALRARIAQLESENARLTGASSAARRGGGVARSIISVVCLVLASVLAATAIVGAWARVELVDADRFVATFGPLIDEPAVQAVVIDQTSDAIVTRLDLDALVGSVFDGLASLDLPPAAVAGLGALRGPAVQGAESLIQQTVATVVESDTFADVWSGALRASHRGMVAAATGGTGAAVVISDSGQIGIQLGPIIDEVKARLIDRGFGFASAIPEIDRTIVVAQSDALVTFRVVYGIAVSAGFWLPFGALALFAAGVLLARRRRVGLLGAGVALAAGAGGLVVGIGVGATAVAANAAGLGIPSDALAVVYERVVADIRQTAVVCATVGVFVIVLCALLGPSVAARAVRSAVGAGNDAVRSALRTRGFDTGRAGVWLDRQRVLVRSLIVVAAVAVLLLLRPLGAGEVALVTVVALLGWWVAEILRAPAAAPAVSARDAPLRP